MSSGRLASNGIVANITVLANDDPHGVFKFSPVLLSVDETNRNVTLTIVRRKGAVGKTRVYYTSVPSSMSLRDVVYDRATENQDYHSMNGFVDFQPNQTLGSIVLRIMDDIIPEDNETIVVNLTSVVLISDPVVQPGEKLKMFLKSHIIGLIMNILILIMFPIMIMNLAITID